MRKLNVLFCIIFLIIFTLGCKQEAVIHVKTTDINKIKNQEEKIYLKTKIKFEISTKQEFNKSKAFLKSKLDEVFTKGVSELKLEESGFENYVICETEIPMTHNKISNDLLSLYYNDDKLNVVYNKFKFKRLQEIVYENYYSKINLEDINLILFIDHNSDKQNQIILYPNYINNNPVLNFSEHKLSKNLTIKLSNVSLKYLENKNIVPIITFSN